MLKNCQSHQGATQKYWKIKNNIKKLKEEGEEEDQVLIYQDFSDDEGKLDQMLEDDQDDEEGEDSQEEDSDYDEEIEMIDIKPKR